MQLSRKNIESAPPWLLDNPIKEELDIAWDSTFGVVQESTHPVNVNVVAAHFIFNLKKEKGSALQIKDKLSPTVIQIACTAWSGKMQAQPSLTLSDYYFEWRFYFSFK